MSLFSKLVLIFSALAAWDGSRMAEAAPGYSVEIDLGDQRAYLLRGGEVVHESPISSGKPGYSTATGTFRILDKDIDYRSSQYGKIVDAQGRTIVADAESDMPVPAGGRFVNAPMPYFMRFNGGIGMHAGYLPGYAASHGCVRMPEESARLFFFAVEPGTPVTVFGSAPTPRARVVQRPEERRWQQRDDRRRESGLARVLLRPFRWRSSTWD